MVSTEMVSFSPYTVFVLLVFVGPSLQQYGAPRHRFSGSSAQSISRFPTDQNFYTLYHTPEVSAEQPPQYSDAFFAEHLINRLNKKDNIPLFKVKVNSQSHYDKNHELIKSYDENRQQNDNYYTTNFIDKKFNPAYQVTKGKMIRNDDNNINNHHQGNHLGIIENDMGNKMSFNKRRLRYQQNNGNSFKTPIFKTPVNYQNNRAYYQNTNTKYTNAQSNHQRNQNNLYYQPKTNTNLYSGINQRHFPYDSLHRYSNKNRRRERIPTNYYTGGSYSYRPNLLERSSNHQFARESDNSFDFVTGAVGTAAILFATISAAGLALNGNSVISGKNDAKINDGFDIDLPNNEIIDKVIIQNVKSNTKPKIVSRNNQKIKDELSSASNESYTYPTTANDKLHSHISLPNEEYIKKPNQNKENIENTNVFPSVKLSTNITKHKDEINSSEMYHLNDNLKASSTFSSSPKLETLQTPKTHNLVNEEIDESPWDYIANVEEESNLFDYQAQKIDKTPETSSYYLTSENNENENKNSIILSKSSYLQNRDETKVINDFDIKKTSLFDFTTSLSRLTDLDNVAVNKTNPNSIEQAQSQMVDSNNILDDMSLKSTTKFPYVKPTEVNKVLEFLTNNLSGITTNFTEIKHITRKDKNSNDNENIEETSTNLTEEKVPQKESQNKISIRLSKKVLEDINMKNEMPEFSSKRRIRSVVSSESLSEDPRGILDDSFNFIMAPFNNMRNYFRSQMEAIGLIKPAQKEETVEKTESEEDKTDENKNEDDSSADDQVSETDVVDNTRNVEVNLDPETADIDKNEDNVPEEENIEIDDESTNVANETDITNNNNGLELSSSTYDKFIENDVSSIQRLNITRVKDNIVYYISNNPQSDDKNVVDQFINSVATSMENSDSDIEGNPKDNAPGVPFMEYTISSDNKSPQAITNNDNDDIKPNTDWFTAEAYDTENIKSDSYPTKEKVHGRLSTFIPKTPGSVSVTQNSENLNTQDMFYSNDFYNFGQGVSPPPMKLITWIVPEDAPTKYQTEAPLSFRFFTQAPIVPVSKNYISKRSKVSSAPLLMRRGPPDQPVSNTGLVKNEPLLTYQSRNILNLNDKSENSQRAYGKEKRIIDDANESSISSIFENMDSTQNVDGRNKIHKGHVLEKFKENGDSYDEHDDLKNEPDMEYNSDVELKNYKHSDYEDYDLLEKVEEIFARKKYDSIVENKLFSEKDSSSQIQEYDLLPTPEPLIASQSFSHFERNDLEKSGSNFNHVNKKTIMEENLFDPLSDSEDNNNIQIKTQSNFDEGHSQNYFDNNSPKKNKNKPTYSVKVSYSSSISTNLDAKKTEKPNLDQHDTSDSNYVFAKETNYDDDDNFDAAYTKSSEDIDYEYTNSFENKENYMESPSTNNPKSEITTDIYTLFENLPLLKSDNSNSNSQSENELLSSLASINSSIGSSSGSTVSSSDSPNENVLESQNEAVGEHSEAVLSMVSFVHSFLCQESQDFIQCVTCLRDNGISATCD